MRLLVPAAIGIATTLAGCATTTPSAAPASGPASTPAIAASASVAAPVTYVVLMPRELGGRPRVVAGNETFHRAVEVGIALQDAGVDRKSMGVDAYGDMAAKNVVIAGAGVSTSSSAAMLTKVFDGLTRLEFKVSGLTLPSDQPNGTTICGAVKVTGTDGALCAWYDDHSIGVIIFLFRKAADVKTEFQDIRKKLVTVY
jgi:hypothetical protein